MEISAFNAQGLRGIIVPVKVGAAKICGAAGKKKDRVKLIKIVRFLSFTPPLDANLLFCSFFLKSHPVYDQTQRTGAVFS
jgi:hypothetical protein